MGFITIIAISVIIVYFSLSQIKKISTNLETFYQHPYTVSKAVRDLNFNLILTFRITETILNNSKYINTILIADSLKKCDSLINLSFDIILKRFLGNKNIVKESKRIYLDWKILNTKFITEILENQNSYKIFIKSKLLSEYENLIFLNTHKISVFARAKANELYLSSKKAEQESYKMLSIIFAILILISILITYIISYSISTQIRSFIKDFKSIFHKSESDIDFHKFTESQLFNKTISELKTSYEEIDKFTEELQTSNEELAATNEEYETLNEELGSANEELASANEEIRTFNENLEKRVEIRTSELKQSEFFFRESQKAAKIGSYKTDFIVGLWESSEVLDEIFGIDKNYNRSIKGWLDIVYDDEKIELENYLNTEIIEKRLDFNKEYRICRINDKQIRWVLGLGSCKFNENGNIISMIGTVQDITDRKLIELELINAKEKAEESDRLKSAFLANLSHEVRTPMNAIIGFSDILSTKKIDDAKQSYFLNIINSSTNQLLTIITDIVNMSKLEVKLEKIIISNFNLNKLMNETFSVMKLDKSKKENVTFNYENEADTSIFNISSDEIKLKQILINLIKNALKFTENGKVNFGYKIQKNNEIEFFVSDTGCGIEPDKKDLIFERFRQADESIAIKYGGNGLGLAISKGYVELLGGRIWVESTIGIGTTFYFTIPHNSQVSPDTKFYTTNVNDIVENDLKKINNKSILIAEDNTNNIEYLKLALNTFSVNLKFAFNGFEAINICKSEHIDIILMDIQMPEVDGIEATKVIKQFKPKLPIIGISAYCSSIEIQNCIEAGCSGFIAKPYNVKNLLTEISKHL